MSTLFHAFKSGTITDNPLTNAATSVNSAGFSALPTVAAPDICWLVLDPEGSAGTPEIVQVTTHTAAATVCTIVREQQTALGGSAGRQHDVGTKWVLALTPSDLAYLAHKILTTKGDILVYGTDATRLPVGTNGSILVAASAEATGLKWNSVSAALGNFYAESTWNPDVVQGVNVSDTDNYGYYIRVGNHVTCWFDVTVTSTGTASSTISVGGLPFARVGSSKFEGVAAGFDVGGDASFNWFCREGTDANSITFQVLDSGTGLVNQLFPRVISLNGSAVNNGDRIAGFFTYRTNVFS